MGEDSDFNDVKNKRGLAAVKKPLKAAIDAAKGKPFGRFIIKPNGVFMITYDKDGEEKPAILFCSYLSPVGLARDTKAIDWSILFEMKNLDDQMVQFLLPLDALNIGGGDAARGEFSRRGGSFGDGIRVKQTFADFTNSIMHTGKNLPRITMAGRTGWTRLKGGKWVFVLPESTIGTTTEKVILKQAADATGFEVSGSVAGWRRDIAAFCVGNSRLIMTVSIAFAASLLDILNREGGGFHNLAESSSGKTTLLCVGSSVTGKPESTIKPMNATSNSFEGEAANCNDCAMFLDEIGEAPPEQIGGIVYKLAGGKGKGRADKNGDAKARNTWRVLFVTTGETSLESMMKTANRRTFAGQDLRLANIPANPGAGHGVYETLHTFPSGAALSEHFRQASQKQHGSAFSEYMTSLVNDRNSDESALHSQLNAYIKYFLHDALPPGSDGQVHRVATRFALVAAGGELATHYGVTGWPEGTALWGARVCFNAWLDQRGGNGPAEVTKLLEQVTAFFERNGESRFVPWDGKPGHSPVINRAGFRRVPSITDPDETGTEYFVFPSAFKEMCEGFDGKWAARQLIEQGMIKGETWEGGKNSVSRNLPGMGKTRCYFFPRADDRRLPSEVPF